jgi:hypothetical protein
MKSDKRRFEREPDSSGMFSSASFLEGMRWRRTHWMLTTKMKVGYGGRLDVRIDATKQALSIVVMTHGGNVREANIKIDQNLTEHPRS